jgi:hypothetical protein
MIARTPGLSIGARSGSTQPQANRASDWEACSWSRNRRSASGVSSQGNQSQKRHGPASGPHAGDDAACCQPSGMAWAHARA